MEGSKKAKVIDCKSKDGIIIGLIDSIISISRVLAPMLRKKANSPKWFSPEIKEALQDLYHDGDLLRILTSMAGSSPYVDDKDQHIKLLNIMTTWLRENNVPIDAS